MSCMMHPRKTFTSFYNSQILCFFSCLLLVFSNFLLLSLSKQELTGIHVHTAEEGKVEELLYCCRLYINAIPNLPFLLSKINRLLVLYSLCAIWHVKRGVWNLSPFSCFSSLLSWWRRHWGDASSTPPPLCLKRILLKSAPDIFYSLLHPSRVKLKPGLLILSSLE